MTGLLYRPAILGMEVMLFLLFPNLSFWSSLCCLVFTFQGHTHVLCVHPHPHVYALQWDSQVSYQPILLGF